LRAEISLLLESLLNPNTDLGDETIHDSHARIPPANDDLTVLERNLNDVAGISG
jgi:hypothetical protein